MANAIVGMANNTIAVVIATRPGRPAEPWTRRAACAWRPTRPRTAMPRVTATTIGPRSRSRDGGDEGRPATTPAAIWMSRRHGPIARRRGPPVASRQEPDGQIEDEIARAPRRGRWAPGPDGQDATIPVTMMTARGPGRDVTSPASGRRRGSASSGQASSRARSRASSARVAVHQPAVEREQVGLRQRARCSPSSPAGAPRARAPASRIARRVRDVLARPAARASSARSLSSATILPVERVDAPAESPSSARLGRLGGGQATVASEPRGDRLERQVVAAGALADDRLDRDVVQEVDVPERLARATGRRGGPRRTAAGSRAARPGATTLVWVRPPALTIATSKSRSWSRSMRAPSWFDWKNVDARARARPPVPRSRRGSRRASRGRRSRARACRPG